MCYDILVCSDFNLFMEYILPALVSTENNISRRVSVDITSIFAGFHRGGGGDLGFPLPQRNCTLCNNINHIILIILP